MIGDNGSTKLLDQLKVPKFLALSESYEEFVKYVKPKISKIQSLADEMKLAPANMECDGFEVFEVGTSKKGLFHYILRVKDSKISCLRDLDSSNAFLLKNSLCFRDSLVKDGQEILDISTYMHYPPENFPLEIHVRNDLIPHNLGFDFNTVKNTEEVLDKISLCPKFFQLADLDVQVQVDPPSRIYADFVNYKQQS